MQIKELETCQKTNKRTCLNWWKELFKTRWLSSEAAGDGVFKENSHYINVLRELRQDIKSGSAAKDLLKKMDNINFLLIIYIPTSCYLNWQHSAKPFKLQN